MGFWDVIKSIGEGMYDALKRECEKISEYTDKYSSYGDKELQKIITDRFSDSTQKRVCKKILMERVAAHKDKYLYEKKSELVKKANDKNLSMTARKACELILKEREKK